MSAYTIDPMPASPKPWQKTDATRLRALFVDPEHAVEEDGVLRWVSNNRPVPPSCFKEAFCTPSPAQVDAYDRDTQAALQAYREAQARRSPDQIAEERAMARAAFGPGAKVVNVITGERVTL